MNTRPTDEDDARRAVDDAARDLSRQRRSWPRINGLIDRLAELRQDNGFGEAWSRVLKGGGDESPRRC